MPAGVMVEEEGEPTALIVVSVIFLVLAVVLFAVLVYMEKGRKAKEEKFGKDAGQKKAEGRQGA
jgi:large-conductance mechanosensitive channel